MMTTRRILVPAFLTAGLLWSGMFLLCGCDSEGSSDSGTIKPSAEQQAALDKANKATAEAHPQKPQKKRRR